MERVSKEEIVITCKRCKDNYDHENFKKLNYRCPCVDKNNYCEPGYLWEDLSKLFSTKVIVTTEVSVSNNLIEPTDYEKKLLPIKCRRCGGMGKRWQVNSMVLCGECMI